MKIEYNPKTGKLTLQYDEEDYSDVAQIEQMMQGRGWKALSEYLVKGRESIIQKIADISDHPKKRDSCQSMASTLKGYMEYMDIPNRVIKMAHMMKTRDEERNKEVNHGRRDDEDE